MQQSSLRAVRRRVFALILLWLNFASVGWALEFKIVRNMTCSDESTVGTLYVDGKEVARTLELPWRNNETNISRIPPGVYSSKIRTDGDRGFRIELQDVEGREHVQIHVGNYQREIEGCILVGRDVVEDDSGVCMVSKSKQTMAEIREVLGTAARDTLRKMTVDWVRVEVVVTE